MRRKDVSRRAQAARLRLLAVYVALAERGEHLFASVLGNTAPVQWAHYPPDDAIDSRSGYQWFYHSHSPEDRAPGAEHGHIHLFARRAAWQTRWQAAAERDFAQRCGHPAADPETRHLLAIGFDAKGIPVNVFTVNSWVTGDLMLSAAGTLDLLEHMQLDTGYAAVDAVITALADLCRPTLMQLLSSRDAALQRNPAMHKLSDTALEVLSACRIVLDA